MEIFEVYSKALDDYKCFLNKAIGLEKSGNLDLAIGSYEYAYDAYIKAMNSRNYDATEKYLKAHSPPPPNSWNSHRRLSHGRCYPGQSTGSSC
jgi:hypothetical protein